MRLNRRIYTGTEVERAAFAPAAMPSTAPITRHGPGAKFVVTNAAAGPGAITEMTVVQRSSDGRMGVVVSGTN